jgi:hypothetical protein
MVMPAARSVDHVGYFLQAGRVSLPHGRTPREPTMHSSMFGPSLPQRKWYVPIP